MNVVTLLSNKMDMRPPAGWQVDLQYAVKSWNYKLQNSHPIELKAYRRNQEFSSGLQNGTGNLT